MDQAQRHLRDGLALDLRADAGDDDAELVAGRQVDVVATHAVAGEELQFRQPEQHLARVRRRDAGDDAVDAGEPGVELGRGRAFRQLDPDELGERRQRLEVLGKRDSERARVDDGDQQFSVLHLGLSLGSGLDVGCAAVSVGVSRTSGSVRASRAGRVPRKGAKAGAGEQWLAQRLADVEIARRDLAVDGDVRRHGLDHLGIAHDPARVREELVPGAVPRERGGADDAHLGMVREADRQVEHVGHDLHPVPVAGAAAAQPQFADSPLGVEPRLDQQERERHALEERAREVVAGARHAEAEDHPGADVADDLVALPGEVREGHHVVGARDRQLPSAQVVELEAEHAQQQVGRDGAVVDPRAGEEHARAQQAALDQAAVEILDRGGRGHPEHPGGAEVADRDLRLEARQRRRQRRAVVEAGRDGGARLQPELGADRGCQRHGVDEAVEDARELRDGEAGGLDDRPVPAAVGIEAAERVRGAVVGHVLAGQHVQQERLGVEDATDPAGKPRIARCEPVQAVGRVLEDRRAPGAQDHRVDVADRGEEPRMVRLRRRVDEGRDVGKRPAVGIDQHQPELVRGERQPLDVAAAVADGEPADGQQRGGELRRIVLGAPGGVALDAHRQRAHLAQNGSFLVDERRLEVGRADVDRENESHGVVPGGCKGGGGWNPNARFRGAPSGARRRRPRGMLRPVTGRTAPREGSQ